jgi:hypothetical protein
MSLKDLLGAKTKKAALLEFKARLYYRGGVPTKGNQHVIPNEIIKAEAYRGFKSRGVYRKIKATILLCPRNPQVTVTVPGTEKALRCTSS